VEDFSKRIPDMLEAATDKVRSLTVDRASRVLKWVSLGLVIAALALPSGEAVAWFTPSDGAAVESLAVFNPADCTLLAGSPDLEP